MRCPNCNEPNHAPDAVYCHMCGSLLGVPAPPSMGGAGFRFGAAYGFSEGVAEVESGGKLGFIDKTGKFVIPPTFSPEGHFVFGVDPFRGFSEGLAAVSAGGYSQRKYGFIDHSGNTVIPVQFSCAWHFSEGLAPIRQDGKWGYVDKTGRVVIRPQYEKAGFFSEGLALVHTVDRGYEYIDKSGHPVIRRTRNLLYDPYGDSFLFHRAKFSSASDFHEGFARVDCANKKSFIDKRGLWIKLDYRAGGDFSEGRSVVLAGKHAQDIRYGYIDTNMNIVIEPKFDYATGFHEGFAVVKMGGKWGCINGTGDIVVPCQYDMVQPFHEGLAAVAVDGLVGYVDGGGSLVIPPQFDSAKAFSEDLAAVKMNGGWGFIDKTGKRVL